MMESTLEQNEATVLEQKVAVITGASQGIGAALVKAYRDRNYRVVATARSVKPSRDDDILVVPGDITNRKTAARAISEGVARFGRIDTLVNNAGIFIAKPFTEYTEADYRAIVGVNIAGFFHITQLAIAEMEKRGSGHVVQITTSLVDNADARIPSVLASLTKGSLNGATKSLAIEYAKRGKSACLVLSATLLSVWWRLRSRCAHIPAPHAAISMSRSTWSERRGES